MCQSRVVQQVYSPALNTLPLTSLQELESSVNKVEQMHLRTNIHGRQAPRYPRGLTFSFDNYSNQLMMLLPGFSPVKGLPLSLA